MKLVVIESPLSGNFEGNIAYARLCVFDSLQRGEAPFASHLIYPQCLDDEVAEDRKLGMTAGFAWGARAELCAVYMDLGVSGGMQAGIDRAVSNGIPIVYRGLEVGYDSLLKQETFVKLLKQLRSTKAAT